MRESTMGLLALMTTRLPGEHHTSSRTYQVTRSAMQTTTDDAVLCAAGSMSFDPAANRTERMAVPFSLSLL